MAADKASDASSQGISGQNPQGDAAKQEAASFSADAVSAMVQRSRRNRFLVRFCVFFLGIGLATACYWYFFLRFEVSTDNAYVAGNQVRISSQVAGSVAAIMADNSQAVQAGQVLVRLDDTDARLALDRARSALAETVRRTRSLMAESGRLASIVELRRQELVKARGDLERRQVRMRVMAVSEEDFSHARDNLAIAEVALQVARDDMQRNQLLLQATPLHEQPSVLLEAHRLRDAWLAWKRCEIKSPVDGYVARRTVQVGMQVTPATPLMVVVPLSEVWVDANFKERDLAHMRIGQPAIIHADIYGSSVRYNGIIVGFSAGTGSIFSLLPPENATGNWIKVVQRVPVKITLEQESLAKAPLLVGLSCSVQVNISDRSGSMLGIAVPQDTPVFKTDSLEHDLAEINNEIDAIIVGHTGEEQRHGGPAN